jgi:hypothetical protein
MYPMTKTSAMTPVQCSIRNRDSARLTHHVMPVPTDLTASSAAFAAGVLGDPVVDGLGVSLHVQVEPGRYFLTSCDLVDHDRQDCSGTCAEADHRSARNRGRGRRHGGDRLSHSSAPAISASTCTRSTQPTSLPASLTT